MNLTFDFIVNKENNTILVTRAFDAPLDIVWSAYTTSEILDQWWAPKPWKARTKKLDFRKGGFWHYAMVGPEGEEHWALAEYLDIEIKKSFTGLDSFTDADGIINKALPQSKWTVSFEDQKDQTLVNFHISYDDLAQLEATIQMGFKEGLTIAMKGLDELLKTIKA